MTGCQIARLTNLYAHCSDLCAVELAGRRGHRYVPRDLRV